jgi:hypothetical protein
MPNSACAIKSQIHSTFASTPSVPTLIPPPIPHPYTYCIILSFFSGLPLMPYLILSVSSLLVFLHGVIVLFCLFFSIFPFVISNAFRDWLTTVRGTALMR